MKICGKIAVVTGAASGIGRALAIALAGAGARRVVCADINLEGARTTAADCGSAGRAERCDVGREDDIRGLIERIEAEEGPIDLFCSNAGIAIGGGVEVPDEEWDRIWRINVMSHVWAARHLVPRMKARGGGWLLNTASAAGLLNQIGSAPYGVTKHAAVALAEWLAFTHGDDGIGVSVLCPQGVRTEMTRGHEDHVVAIDGMLEPEEVAEVTLAALREERFLILPHPKVREYMRLKAEDTERWIGGMRKLNRRFGRLPDPAGGAAQAGPGSGRP